MATVLTDSGFEVSRYIDADLPAFRNAVEVFTNSVKEGDTALFYYAGHGVEYNGENYLLPVSIAARGKSGIPEQSISLALILNRLDKRHARNKILILDACRSVPMDRGGGGGLAPVDVSTGQFIAYATAPGKTASDGSDANGLFTKYLVKYLSVPGLDINEIFTRVRTDVFRDSNHEQTPGVYTQLIGQFYFRGGTATHAILPEITSADPIKGGLSRGSGNCPADDATPKNEGEYFARARCDAGAGNYSSAMQFVNRALKINPGNAGYYVLKGSIAGKLHNYADAEAALRHAIDLDPEKADAYFELGMLQDGQGNSEDSSKSLFEAYKLAPNRSDICLALAGVLDKKGLRREAEDLRKKAEMLQ